MIRTFIILALLHGTIFVGAGSALKHIFHEIEGDAAEHQHHGHHSSEMAGSTDASADTKAADDEWINCVFCLDGVGGTGITMAIAGVDFPTTDFFRTDATRPSFDRVVVSFYARAPPAFS